MRRLPWLVLLPVLAFADPLPARKIGVKPVPAGVDSRTVVRAQDINGILDHVSGWVNVRSFGAKGDGVTDDTAAIQAAIESVSVTAWSGSVAGQYVRGGGTVVLPSGVFRITRPLLRGPYTRILGFSPVAGFNHPAFTQSITDLTKQKASILYADFASPNVWAIDSAVYTAATGLPIGYKAYSTGAQVDAGTINMASGATIENIFFLSGATPVYGAVRLNAAPNSVIRNCGAYGFKVGLGIFASWQVAVENWWSLTYWYGLITAMDANSIDLRSVYANRLTTPAPTAPTSGEVPDAVLSDYSGADLSGDYRLYTTGLYARYVNSFDVAGTFEHWQVGAQALNSGGTFSRLYSEDNGVHVAAVASYIKIPMAYAFNSVPQEFADVGASARVDVTLSPTGNATGSFVRVSPYSSQLGLYTPAFSASGGGAIGNGVIVGRWSQAGVLVTADVTMTAGTTTAFGTGVFEFSLPVAPVTPGGGAGSAIRQGVSEDRVLAAADVGSGKARLFVPSSSAGVQQGTPRTYAATDVIHFTLTYVAAP